MNGRYWVHNKLPQIYTVIAYICIGKVAWIAVYICGNLWNALFIAERLTWTDWWIIWYYSTFILAVSSCDMTLISRLFILFSEFRIRFFLKSGSGQFRSYPVFGIYHFQKLLSYFSSFIFSWIVISEPTLIICVLNSDEDWPYLETKSGSNPARRKGSNTQKTWDPDVHKDPESDPSRKIGSGFVRQVTRDPDELWKKRILNVAFYFLGINEFF